MHLQMVTLGHLEVYLESAKSVLKLSNAGFTKLHCPVFTAQSWDFSAKLTQSFSTCSASPREACRVKAAGLRRCHEDETPKLSTTADCGMPENQRPN